MAVLKEVNSLATFAIFTDRNSVAGKGSGLRSYGSAHMVVSEDKVEADETGVLHHMFMSFIVP